ncbi:MAG: nucleotidyltransferase family protein [Candidatus Latescibacterota bacterium]
MTFQDKVERVTKQFKQTVEKKYNIIEIKLFGSSARGDYSEASDIDIMVKLPKANRNIEEDLFNIAYDLELEYDCLIDVIVFSENMENKIPLYQNIKKEGVAI